MVGARLPEVPRASMQGFRSIMGFYPTLLLLEEELRDARRTMVPNKTSGMNMMHFL
jgi:hypothetical protein